MKNSITIRTDNIGLVLDRLRRALPQGSHIMTQRFYTRSLNKAKQLSEKTHCHMGPDKRLASSAKIMYRHAELEVRPHDLPFGMASHSMIKHRNVWAEQDVAIIHNGHDSKRMINFLRLRVGQRVRFERGRVVVDEVCLTRGKAKCLVIYEKM